MTAAREKLNEILMPYLEILARGHAIEAILSAFPHLGAPTEDVVEAARQIALRKWCGRFIGLAESKELEADIAALVAAHAARERADEREACAKVVDDYKKNDPEYAVCAGYRLFLAAAIRARP